MAHKTSAFGLVDMRTVMSGLMNPESFDKNEYFYYDDPENGEFHEVVPGKFIAFKGPWEDRYVLHVRAARA